MAIQLHLDDDLSVRARLGKGSAACVVTFDPYVDERRLDRPGFAEEFLLDRGIDAVHVVPRDNDWYQYPSLPEVARRIAAVTAAYPTVVSYGSSMGGYAAIRFGRLVGAGRAVAISPQFSADPATPPFEPRWRQDAARIDFLHECSPPGAFVDEAVILYDPRGPDRPHVELYRSRTHVVDVAIPFSGHPTGGFLAELGLLSRGFLEALDGRLDIPAFVGEARAGRRLSTTYWLALSASARTAKRRAAFAGEARKLQPGNGSVAAIHALHLLKAGARLDAFAAAEQALRLEPDLPTVLIPTSIVFERGGETARARALLERVVALHPDVPLYRRHLSEFRRRTDVWSPRRVWTGLRKRLQPWSRK